MVGSGMFNFLNLRLQQIMGTNESFAGICLITVGNLFQLKPVFDKWIFENSQSGYNEFVTLDRVLHPLGIDRNNEAKRWQRICSTTQSFKRGKSFRK